jgi:hypothetical protein
MALGKPGFVETFTWLQVEHQDFLLELQLELFSYR